MKTRTRSLFLLSSRPHRARRRGQRGARATCSAAAAGSSTADSQSVSVEATRRETTLFGTQVRELEATVDGMQRELARLRDEEDARLRVIGDPDVHPGGKGPGGSAPSALRGLGVEPRAVDLHPRTFKGVFDDEEQPRPREADRHCERQLERHCRTMVTARTAPVSPAWPGAVGGATVPRRRRAGFPRSTRRFVGINRSRWRASAGSKRRPGLRTRASRVDPR